MHARTLLPLLALLLAPLSTSAQNTLYGYGIANWRNGPVVVFSPIFETTEAFTKAAVMEWVRGQWPEEFTPETDMDVVLFATLEEAGEHRYTLERKYGMRKLDVNLLEADSMPHTPLRPEPAITAPLR